MNENFLSILLIWRAIMVLFLSQISNSCSKFWFWSFQTQIHIDLANFQYQSYLELLKVNMPIKLRWIIWGRTSILIDRRFYSCIKKPDNNKSIKMQNSLNTVKYFFSNVPPYLFTALGSTKIPIFFWTWRTTSPAWLSWATNFPGWI